MTFSLERIEVADVDPSTAADLAAIDNAALDGVPLRHHTPETFLLDCQDRNGEGPDAGLWLAREGRQLVGYAALTLNRFANLDGAKILGAVHPTQRRRGIGRALLAEAEAATDRPRLRAPAWDGTAGMAALPHLGYVRGLTHEVRRLSETPGAAGPSGQRGGGGEPGLRPRAFRRPVPRRTAGRSRAAP
jgi:GNAT superfamily N-acetyltransferase